MKLYSKPLKTKLSFTAILLAFLMAYAWFLIVLALIVAVVAGVIVYELYHVAVRLLPKEPAVTNNAVEIVNGNSVRMKSLP